MEKLRHYMKTHDLTALKSPKLVKHTLKKYQSHHIVYDIIEISAFSS